MAEELSIGIRAMEACAITRAARTGFRDALRRGERREGLRRIRESDCQTRVAHGRGPCLAGHLRRQASELRGFGCFRARFLRAPPWLARSDDSGASESTSAAH